MDATATDVKNVQDIPSCTPRSLRRSSMSKLAIMLIDNAIPLSLLDYIPDLYTTSLNLKRELDKLENEMECKCDCSEWIDRSDPSLQEDTDSSTYDSHRPDSGVIFTHPNIDHVILAEAGTPLEHLLPFKQILLEHLQEVVRWCCEEVWLGGCYSNLACEVRSCCYERLRWLKTYYCYRYPLLLLTKELLFCSEAGHNPMGTGMSRLSASHCAAYGRFVSKLQPFSITKLYTSSLNFECPSIITTICKHSPMLKFVHLKIDFAVGNVLREIGKVTPNLETLIIIVREFEVYDYESHTANIVISVQEDFGDELFVGFFDGMGKEDIDKKIEQGGIEDIPLSYPKLKYVDVGSHRDVRELLHYILCLYPDIRSISCDGENWELSKYSLDFPTVTPSTLGDGPIVLDYKKKIHTVQDMSFSSFCLASRLTEIMERYRNLKHINLHIHEGPWKISSTAHMTRDLLVSTNCHSLTICVDVYMSKNDLVNLYQPALQAVGSMLTVLQFHFTNEVTSSAIRQLINLCHELKELAIVSSCERCEVAEYDEEEEIVQLNQQPALTCLGISSPYNITKALFALIMDILLVAPNITTLDLEFGGQNSIEWLLNTAAAQKFVKVQCLRLSLLHYGPTMDLVKNLNRQDVSTIFEPVITSAPKLKQLLIGKGCKCLFKALEEKYGKSGLQISSRNQPCVAFRILSTRYC